MCGNKALGIETMVKCRDMVLDIAIERICMGWMTLC
jgi:hypothetical protein